jgi:microsomal dipeptidase-like Zn-dependent dipeptidase
VAEELWIQHLRTNQLVRGLIEMRYSDMDLRKIMGEKLLRVMKRNEEVARS